MRTHTGCTWRAAHTSLLFCCTSPGVQGPPAHGIEPVRQWGNLLCKEGRSPETAQCSIPVLKGNTGVPSLDEILTLLHPGQEMPLVPSCPGSVFSDSCPFPAVQLCGVASIVTGIIKVTLLRQQSHCWVSACLSEHLPPIFLSWALSSLGLTCWNCERPSGTRAEGWDCCVPLARWFLVDTASKTPSQFFSAYYNCSSLF